MQISIERREIVSEFVWSLIEQWPLSNLSLSIPWLKTKGGNTTISGESMSTSVIKEGNDPDERHEEEQS